MWLRAHLVCCFIIFIAKILADKTVDRDKLLGRCHQISWKNGSERTIWGKWNWCSVENMKRVYYHCLWVTTETGRREVDVPYHQPDPATSRRQTKQNSVNKNSRGQICCVVYCFNSRPSTRPLSSLLHISENKCCPPLGTNTAELIGMISLVGLRFSQLEVFFVQVGEREICETGSSLLVNSV